MDDNEAALKALAEAGALERGLAELLAREAEAHRRLTLEVAKALAASGQVGPFPGPAPPAAG